MTLNGRRRMLLALVLVAFLLVGIGVALWWLISGRYHESTDDAYIASKPLLIGAA